MELVTFEDYTNVVTTSDPLKAIVIPKACGCVVGGGRRVGCVRGVWGLGRNQLAILGTVWAVAPLYYPDALVNPDTCLGGGSRN